MELFHRRDEVQVQVGCLEGDSAGVSIGPR